MTEIKPSNDEIRPFVWNYRLMKRTDPFGRALIGVYEVSYDADTMNILGYSMDPEVLVLDDADDLHKSYIMMKEAFDRPILDGDKLDKEIGTVDDGPGYPTGQDVLDYIDDDMPLTLQRNLWKAAFDDNPKLINSDEFKGWLETHADEVMESINKEMH